MFCVENFQGICDSYVSFRFNRVPRDAYPDAVVKKTFHRNADVIQLFNELLRYDLIRRAIGTDRTVHNCKHLVGEQKRLIRIVRRLYDGVSRS